MSQIAKRAGISKGTIYLYFSSKDELFSAIVGEVWHQTSVRHGARRVGPIESAQSYNDDF
jgi:AcrR family transcriptional regulator